MGRREMIEDQLFLDFEPLVRAVGVELLDVEMLSENKMTVLRATIYRPEGITLDDCASAQRILSDRLDEADPISGSYSLEVSSPGLERTLRRPKEFVIYKGELCQVNLFAPEEGKRTYQGRLLGLEKDSDGNERIAIETVATTSAGGKKARSEEIAGRRLSFDRKNVSKAQLIFSEENLKKGRN